jgi:hypothetical protein
MHPGSPAEPALAAWGITTGGKPAFIGLAPGTGESFDAWKDFLTACTSTCAPPPAGRATHGWRPWRPRPSSSSPTAPPGCGATSPAPPFGAGHIVMTDPEGNEFCLD